jgi:hypothetical protein
VARNVLGRQFIRQALRDDVALAQHAQGLREENYTRGNKTERKQFYGRMDAPHSDEAEQRVTSTSADREYTARRAHEGEQARAHVSMGTKERDSIHRELQESGW